MNNPNQDQKKGSVNKPVLMGCLIFIGVLFVIGIAGGIFIWRNVGSIVKEASETVEKEMRAEEDKLRSMPASGIQSLSHAQLIAALKADRAGTLSKYGGKVIALSGYLSESPTLAEAVPIDLPLDFMIIQATTDKNENTETMIPCLYSKAQKATVTEIKPLQPVQVRGKLSQDKDGDLSLAPCIVGG